MKVRGNRESARGEGEGREETVEKDRGREEGVKRCDNSPTPASKRNGGFEIMLRYNITPGYGRNLGRSDSKASY